MNEPIVPLSKLMAYVLWSWTALLLLAGWSVFYREEIDMGIMLATSACVTGLGAATLTIRCYARHVAGLVRMAGGLAPSSHDERILRSIRE